MGASGFQNKSESIEIELSLSGFDSNASKNSTNTMQQAQLD